MKTGCTTDHEHGVYGKLPMMPVQIPAAHIQVCLCDTLCLCLVMHTKAYIYIYIYIRTLHTCLCIYAFLHFWTGLLSFSCVLENGWGVQAFYIHGDDDSAAVGYRLLNHYADGEAPDQFTDADSTIRCVSVSLSICSVPTCDCVVTKYGDVAKFVSSRCRCRCRSQPTAPSPSLFLSHSFTHSLAFHAHAHAHLLSTHTHTHTHTNHNHKLVHRRISIGRRSTNAYAFPAEGLEELDEMTRAFLGIVEYEVSPHL